MAEAEQFNGFLDAAVPFRGRVDHKSRPGSAQAASAHLAPDFDVSHDGETNEIRDGMLRALQRVQAAMERLENVKVD